MSAAGSRSEAPQPRAEGEGRIAVAPGRGGTRLARLHQRGSAKILCPRHEGPGFEAVLLNTAGGLAGGDRFKWAAEAGAGARLTLATQAAERAYRAQPSETAMVETRLALEAGARIDWLPQETILFDGAALARRLEVDMAPDATLLAVEPVVFGRTAMGETVRRAAFADRWRIRRGGALLHAEALRLEGPVADILARPAVLGGGAAMATVLLVAPDAEARLEAVRAAGAAASAWDGRLVARFAAADGAALRRALIPVLMVLRGAALPRVWTI